MSSFVKKILRFSFKLATGNFGITGANVLTLEGLRAGVVIEHAGGQAMSVATIQIFGMTRSDMNQLAMLAWKPFDVQRNFVTVEAGDEGGVMTRVFQGTILNAWPDYRQAPDVFFHVESQAQFYDQINPVPPLSYPGPVAVADIMSGLASAMGLAFENNGVSVQLDRAYFPGTAIDQARAVAQHANIDLYIDGTELAISPKGVPRKGFVPVISTDTGMVGYPVFDKNGITVTTLFNPGVKFGGEIEVVPGVALPQGLIPPSNGRWWANSITHRLDANRPGGAWFTDITATSFGFPVLTR